MTDAYTFPFSTCEKPSNMMIAQPTSVLVNLISIVIILYFLLHCQQKATLMFFILLLCFEMWHTWSHVRHTPGFTQVRVIHVFAYLLNISILYMMVKFTGVMPSQKLVILLVGLTFLDVWAFAKLPMIFYFTTQLTLVGAILWAYLSLTPRQLQVYFIAFFVALTTLVAMFINESLNCKRMLKHFVFPYHALIEMVGVIAFLLLGIIFSTWDKIYTTK